MKFKKLLAPLCVAMLLVACSKDNTTPTHPETEPFPKISKVLYYQGADTTAEVYYTDSVVYQPDGKLVDKIITSFPTGKLVHTYAYNAAGKISYLKIRGINAKIQYYDVDYRMVYKNGLVDTLTYTNNAFEPINNYIYYVCTYNAQQQLEKITNWQYQYYDARYLDYLTTYFSRNTNTGKIDSFHTVAKTLVGGIEETPFKPKNFYLDSKGATDSVLPINPAYLLVLGLRNIPAPFSAVEVNLFSRQFLMPHENLLRSGSSIQSGFVALPFTVNYTLDATGRVSFLSYITDGDLTGATSFSIKLQYKN